MAAELRPPPLRLSAGYLLRAFFDLPGHFHVALRLAVLAVLGVGGLDLGEVDHEMLAGRALPAARDAVARDEGVLELVLHVRHPLVAAIAGGEVDLHDLEGSALGDR